VIYGPSVRVDNKLTREGRIRVSGDRDEFGRAMVKKGPLIIRWETPDGMTKRGQRASESENQPRRGSRAFSPD